MTITVTADEAFVPPRNEIEVSVPADNVMTAVNVWRNDSSGRSLVRSQPSAGFESRTVFDYECPYGQNVTYDWEATYYDPADNVTTFSENFASWPGSWTGDTGNGSVLSNELTYAGASSVTRTFSAAWDIITFARLSGFSSPPINPLALVITFASGSNLSLFGDYTGAPVVIRRTDDGLTVTSVFGVTTYLGARGDVASIVVTGDATIVGAITVETVAATLDVAETSASVNLDPADAWLIAPQAPALSVPLSNSNQQAAGIRDIAAISNASNTTVHRILGSSTPVTTTTGNRQGDVLAATVYTHTSEERQALRALLNPDTPILVNVPSSWDLDLEYGFYQVGDVTETRPYTLGGIPMRDFTLPLTKVRSPEVDVENPGWSYAQVATTWLTYTEVLANYATYADLAVDNRS